MRLSVALLIVLSGLSGSVSVAPGQAAAAKTDSEDHDASQKYSAAAERGSASVQFSLGNMYRDGDGVSQDFVTAVKWYERAADQGHAKAQSSLGIMHLQGLGVPQDYGVALNWLQKAANAGLGTAQYTGTKF
jgi:TPR repeat protein